MTGVFCICICCLLLTGCTWFKKDKDKLTGKEDVKVLESALINMSEEDMRKRFGEPTMVAKTPENRILWTYTPSWKLMPDNSGTLYVEFEDGKVIKVLKVR